MEHSPQNVRRCRDIFYSVATYTGLNGFNEPTRRAAAAAFRGPRGNEAKKMLASQKKPKSKCT